MDQEDDRADTPTAEERESVSALCAARGVRGASRVLGLDPSSVLRISAGQPVRRGTVALLRRSLSFLAAEVPK